MGLFKKLRNKVNGDSESERLARSVTANNSEAPDPGEMHQLANITRYHEEAEIVMKVLQERLNDIGIYWHIEKALYVLLYLMSYGGSKVVEWYRKNTHLVRALSTYHQHDANDKECAGKIRNLADRIVALGQDQPKLDKARADAWKELDAENKEEEKGRPRREPPNAAYYQMSMANVAAAGAAG